MNTAVQDYFVRPHSMGALIEKPLANDLKPIQKTTYSMHDFNVQDWKLSTEC